LKFSKDVKKLSGKELTKFEEDSEKAEYTDKVVAGRTETAPTPSDADAPF